MHNSRLLQIIKSFSQEEMNAFSGFLKAGYIKDKKPEELIRLFDLLQEHFPDLSHLHLSKEHAYRIVFNKTTWVPGRFDKLLSRFLKATYHFIALHFYHEDHNPKIAVCQFLQKRNLKKVFNRTLNKWSKQFDGIQFYDSNILYERFLMKELLVLEQTQQINPKAELKLPEMLENLDQYYILTKLEYACQLLAINLFVLPVNIKNSLKSFEYLDALIDLPHLQLPVIQVYYHAYRMMNSAANLRSENFSKFKALLYQYDNLLSVTQKKALHTLIRNYTIFHYHNGQGSFLKNAFEIYKDHLKRGFLYHDDKILSQPFLNMVTFGLRLKEYDWVHQFIMAHRDKIVGTESSELIFNFNMALYHFYLKNYDKAMDLLPDNFTNIYYKIGAKRLELILYFETELEILDSKIDSFKIFIYRMSKSEITQKQKKANNNFIHLLKQIRHPKTEVSYKRIENLKSKIQSLEYIAEKDWLIDVLDRMKT